jgi:hypothetical protein
MLLENLILKIVTQIQGLTRTGSSQDSYMKWLIVKARQEALK